MQEKELLAAGHKSVSSGALVCDSAKIFLTSMFSYLLLSNPTIKLKMELQIGRRLLIVNQLGQSYIMVGQ